MERAAVQTIWTGLAHGSNEPAATERSEHTEAPEKKPTVPVERAVSDEPTSISSDLAPSAPPVPAALVAHARKVADAHQARTGSPIDTATLRARLGVPAPLADRIAAQLT